MELSFDEKIKYYEQAYFTDDKPIPFLDNLMIYPARMKDYYTFYSLINCFTIDKIDDPNPECLGMSDLDYVFYLIGEGDAKGEAFKHQFINLLELVFRIKNGIFCSNPECKHKEATTYEQLYKKIDEIKMEALNQNQEKEEIYFDKKKREFLEEISVCPVCGSPVRDYICIKQREDKNIFDLYIGTTVVKRQDYVDLKRTYCYQNILDYNDDYIDPELKAALDEAAALRNKGMKSPSLERQKACLVASTPYKFEDLENITIRKFNLLLKVVDAKMTYTIYKQAECSGFVTFKGDIDHWIYTSSNAKQDRFKNIMSVDQIESKIGSAAK